MTLAGTEYRILPMLAVARHEMAGVLGGRGGDVHRAGWGIMAGGDGVIGGDPGRGSD